MNTKTMLIIEDDSVLLRGLKDNFEARGYVVQTANDGQRGLYALLDSPPDVLLLDLMLPRLNGCDICRKARAQHLGMPILMLTAKSEEADVLRGLNCGADDYVTKPFNIGDLVVRVEALQWLNAHPAAEMGLDVHSVSPAQLPVQSTGATPC